MKTKIKTIKTILAVVVLGLVVSNVFAIDDYQRSRVEVALQMMEKDPFKNSIETSKGLYHMKQYNGAVVQQQLEALDDIAEDYSWVPDGKEGDKMAKLFANVLEGVEILREDPTFDNLEKLEFRYHKWANCTKKALKAYLKS